MRSKRDEKQSQNFAFFNLQFTSVRVLRRESLDLVEEKTIPEKLEKHRFREILFVEILNNKNVHLVAKNFLVYS